MIKQTMNIKINAQKTLKYYNKKVLIWKEEQLKYNQFQMNWNH